MDPIEYGAKQAIQNCLRVKKGEKVVVITDLETEKLAEALIRQAEAVGAVVKKFVMEDFGDRPRDGSNPLKFPDEIRDAMTNAQVSIYIAQSRKGEVDSFRDPMLKLATGSTIRHAHMICINERIMKTGVAADYSKVQEISNKLYDIVSKAKEIHVTSKRGTDVSFTIDNRINWIVHDGYIKPGDWQNLPSGEICTAPADANGVVVVDGCFGDYFDEKYGDISSTPLKFELKKGRCVRGSVVCKNDELKEEFEQYVFESEENSDRVGELGIGTNIGLTELICNMLQDEKLPGVHVALGDPFAELTGADWTCKSHLDGIIRDVTMEVDGRVVMEDSEFKI